MLNYVPEESTTQLKYLLNIPGHSPNEFGLWGRGSTNLRRTSTFVDGLVPPKLLRRYQLNDIQKCICRTFLCGSDGLSHRQTPTTSEMGRDDRRSVDFSGLFIRTDISGFLMRIWFYVISKHRALLSHTGYRLKATTSLVTVVRVYAKATTKYTLTAT